MAELPYQTAIRFSGFGNIPWGEKIKRGYQLLTGRTDYRGTAAQNTMVQNAMLNGSLLSRIGKAPSPAPAPAPNSATSLVEKMGEYLKVQKSPTEKLPYETYADPQRKVFNEFERTQMRPEYEYYTKTPFLQNSAITGAVNDSNLSGKAGTVFNMGLGKIERSYQDQVDAAKRTYEDMINQGYQRKIKEIADSPTANLNIPTLDPSKIISTVK